MHGVFRRPSALYGAQLRDVLERAAPRTHVAFSEIEGATHWYDAWRARLPKALIDLLAGPDAGQCQTGIVK
jgi:hypothetical protein